MLYMLMTILVLLINEDLDKTYLDNDNNFDEAYNNSTVPVPYKKGTSFLIVKMFLSLLLSIH